MRNRKTDLDNTPASGEKTPWNATVHKIGSNTLRLAFGRFATQAFLVVFTILVARRMGEVGLGGYAFMAAIVMIGNVLTTFGTDTLIMREVAANRDFSHLFPSLVLQLCLSALFLLGISIFSVYFMDQNRENSLALIIYSFSLFPLALFSVASAVLRGMALITPLVGLNFIQAVLQTFLAWLILDPLSSLLELSILILSVQVFIAVLAGGFILRKIPEIKAGWKIQRQGLMVLFISTTSLAAISAIKILFQKITIIILGLIQGAAITGWYSAAARVVEAAQIGHIAALGALFPLMSYTYAQGKKIPSESKRILDRSFWLLLGLGFVAAILIFFLAEPLVGWFYGPEFQQSVLALHFLAWLMIPYSLNIYLSSSLIATRNDRGVLFIFTISLITLTLLNLWWIPRWGLTGACLGTLTAEAIQAGLFLFLWFSYSRSKVDNCQHT